MPVAAQKATPVLPPLIGGVSIMPWPNAPVAKPGIYAGMPIDIYHSADAAIEVSVSSGNLRTIFTRSPAHYWVDSYYNDKRIVDDEESEALIFGRAAHHWLFGFRQDFHKEFVVEPETMPDPKTGEIKPFSRQRQVCKVWAEQRQDEGMTVLRQSQVDAINGMWESLHRNSLVRNGLLNGRIETSWFMKHAKTGLWIKIRPDAAPGDSLDFVDLKTIHSADWQSMQRAIFEHGYFIQAGLIAMVVRELCGKPMTSFTFCFIEKKPPYDIGIVVLKENEIDRGIRAAEKALETFAQCWKAKHWPGRYPDPLYIEMSEYQQKAIDARLA